MPVNCLNSFAWGSGNYTEADIKQIARCFTGWEVRKGRFRFNKNQFDNKDKSFFGGSGNLTGEEAVRIVLEQPVTPEFIAQKLIRFFVFDLEPIEQEFAQPIAEHLRESDFDIGSTVRKILTSRVFYSEQAIARKIKGPVELAVGTLKFLGATTNMNDVIGRLERLGQLPLYPPNVKGWDGGTVWINASTVIARANLIVDMLSSGATKFKAGDLDSWLKRNGKKLAAEDFSGLEQYWLASPSPESTVRQLKKIGIDRPRELFATIASMPEFQLN